MKTTIDNITLIGTSHISADSVKEVKEFIVEHKPDIVCVELDKYRLQSLLSKQKTSLSLGLIRQVGVTGFLFALMAQYVEKKLGEKVGVFPGKEMKTAVQLAKKEKKKIGLIDQDVRITLRRISKEFGWREKFRAAGDLIKGLLGFGPQIRFDVRKVPDAKVILALMEFLKERYPKLYQVLISERNSIMVKRLQKLTQEHPDHKIVAVVGAGHVPGMKKLLEDSPQYSYSFSVSA